MADMADQLIQALQEELHGQQTLVAVLENKLQAMQHYDMKRLEALVANEQQLLHGIRQKANRRDLAVKRLTALVFPHRRGDRAKANELAQHIDESRRRLFLGLTGALREMVEKAQRLNRINAIASQKVLQHLGHVFRIISQTGVEIGLYNPVGKKATVEQRYIVDALA